MHTRFRTAAAFAAPAFCLILQGCDNPNPRVDISEWTVTKSAGGQGYDLLAKGFVGGDGGWFPTLELTDVRGCQEEEGVPAIFTTANGGNVVLNIRHHFTPKATVSKAVLVLTYGPNSASTASVADFAAAQQHLFREERVLAAPAGPPKSAAECRAHPAETASERKVRLRKKAQTDPDGADAEAIDNMGRNELVATAINSAGFLCARVSEMHPMGGDIIVSCVEYRDGRGRVKYRVNPQASSVEQL